MTITDILDKLKHIQYLSLPTFTKYKSLIKDYLKVTTKRDIPVCETSSKDDKNITLKSFTFARKHEVNSK